MKFEKIFKAEGLYVADSFAKGVCFEIKKNSISGERELYLTTFAHAADLLPTREVMPVYEELFRKEYAIAYTKQSLFKK